MKKIAFLLVLVAACAAQCVAAPVSLFYIENNAKSVQDFLDHSSQIGLAVPTWYHVDEKGKVTGKPNPVVLERAKSEHLPVAPIVALFNKEKFHALASSASAQEAMNQAFVREAKQYGYVGFQIDFENIDLADRDLLSALVAKTADVLHKNGLQISIATVPNAPGHAGEGDFSKWIYNDWQGAYDLAALAKSVDLVCLMTYDEHTSLTTPGPVSGWQWTVANLEYALKFVPAEKLSLGIPLYGYHWSTKAPYIEGTSHKPHTGAKSISVPKAVDLARQFNGKIQWDEEDRTTFFYIYRDQMREWVFYPDARTFGERYDLVKKYGLQGFCSWVMGEEDQAIWKLLPAREK